MEFNFSIISGSMIIEGDIVENHRLLINGIVNGNIESSHDVIIDGEVYGDIKAKNAYICKGSVYGKIVAEKIYCDDIASSVSQGYSGELLAYRKFDYWERKEWGEKWEKSMWKKKSRLAERL